MPVSRWPLRIESGSSLPRSFGELRLVVEQVHLRRGAGLEQVDDALGLRREMRQARQAAVLARRQRLAPRSGRSRVASAATPMPAPQSEEVAAGQLQTVERSPWLTPW